MSGKVPNPKAIINKLLPVTDPVAMAAAKAM